MEKKRYVRKMITVFTGMKVYPAGSFYFYSETSQGEASNVRCLCVLLFWCNKDDIFFFFLDM